MDLKKVEAVWEICKFWILLNDELDGKELEDVWEICKFWILLNWFRKLNITSVFERYVNFEFY